MKLALFRTAAFFAFAGAAASAAAAEHPQLLKRHGIVYGVRHIDDHPGCKGAFPGDSCEVYKVSATIIEVYADDERGVFGFDLPMPGWGVKFQNIVNRLPAAADRRLQSGVRVRVIGSISGNGAVAVPDKIIFTGRR